MGVKYLYIYWPNIRLVLAIAWVIIAWRLDTGPSSQILEATAVFQPTKTNKLLQSKRCCPNKYA
jgi:hypothetical protein